jgi:phosphotransferase system HPr (HPr) family protein
VNDSPALQREFTVASELGLHARPAGQFVRIAGRFSAEITVSAAGEWVSARSVLSLLSLAASQGTRLKIRACGNDAAEAIDALGRLLESPSEYGSGTGSRDPG